MDGAYHLFINCLVAYGKQILIVIHKDFPNLFCIFLLGAIAVLHTQDRVSLVSIWKFCVEKGGVPVPFLKPRIPRTLLPQYLSMSSILFNSIFVLWTSSIFTKVSLWHFSLCSCFWRQATFLPMCPKLFLFHIVREERHSSRKMFLDVLLIPFSQAYPQPLHNSYPKATWPQNEIALTKQ